MPPILKEVCKKERGLVLCTGPTGSGKSTTLAAMVDYINENWECHILTVEDPIEFVHTPEEVADQPARGRDRTRSRSPRRCAARCVRIRT